MVKIHADILAAWCAANDFDECKMQVGRNAAKRYNSTERKSPRATCDPTPMDAGTFVMWV